MTPFVASLMGFGTISGSTVTHSRRPRGDMQSGSDYRRPRGDMQSGSDIRKAKDAI